MKNCIVALLLWTLVASPKADAQIFSNPAIQDSAAENPLLSSNCPSCWNNSKKLMRADSINYKKALEFAPILWFADDEKYFPTMPFFSAFDSVDNDGSNPQIDFGDPQEIAPSENNNSAPEDSVTKLKLASWDTLDAWYNGLVNEAALELFVKNRKNYLQSRIDSCSSAIDTLQSRINALVDSLNSPNIANQRKARFKSTLEMLEYFNQGRISLIRHVDSLKYELNEFSSTSGDRYKKRVVAAAKKRLCAVFYNISTKFTARHLKANLRNDEQFWHRLPEKHRKYLDAGGKLTVYEYYFYYINDNGLSGHAEDLERAFVFVPDDTTISFRIVIAAGHSNLTPNNVLFYEADAIPLEYQSHLHILVELGGHSNAPDLKGNGLFEPGVDANWHTENLWGTRDSQAAAGSGAIGQYASWMTFPRDKAKRVFPPDPALEKLNPQFCYKLLPAESFQHLVDQHLEQFAKLPKWDDLEKEYKAWEPRHRHPKRDEELRRIKNKMTEVDSTQKSIIGKIDTLFGNMGLPATGFAAMRSSRQQYMQRMQHFLLWRKDLAAGAKKQTGIDIPKGCDYGAALWFDSDLWKDEKFHFSHPEIRLAGLLRLPPGIWEVHAGYNAPRIHENDSSPAKRRLELGIIYEKFYTDWRLSPFSYYAGFLGYIKPDNPDNLTFQFGISIVPPFFFRPDNTLRHFRLRFGAVLWDGGVKDPLRLDLQLGIHLRPIPLTKRPYVKIASDKHKIWKHEDYGKPQKLFKQFLFRRRSWDPLEVNSMGIWIDWTKKESPEYKVSYILPAWGPLPVKLDGVLELQAGRSYKFQDDKKWTCTLYYERFYGRLLSWYLNIACSNISHLTVNDFGGGLSIMFPLLAGKRFLGIKNRYWPPWIHLRLGLRSAIDKEPLQLSQPRLELQLGIH